MSESTTFKVAIEVVHQCFFFSFLLTCTRSRCKDTLQNLIPKFYIDLKDKIATLNSP